MLEELDIFTRCHSSVILSRYFRSYMTLYEKLVQLRRSLQSVLALIERRSTRFCSLLARLLSRSLSLVDLLWSAERQFAIAKSTASLPVSLHKWDAPYLFKASPWRSLRLLSRFLHYFGANYEKPWREELLEAKNDSPGEHGCLEIFACLSSHDVSCFFNLSGDCILRSANAIWHSCIIERPKN